MKMFPPKKRNITKLEKKERQEGLQVSRFGNLNEFKCDAKFKTFKFLDLFKA